MATIKFIEDRISGKQKEIEKLNKKIERIRKAEATGWTVNPYYYHESDLKYALRDLQNAETALADWQAKLAAEKEKESSRSVPAILEFLEGWKRRCFDFYNEGLQAAFAEKAAVADLGRRVSSLHWGSPEYEKANAEYQARHKAYYEKLHGYMRKLTKEEKAANPRYRYTSEVKVREGEWEYIQHYFRSTYEESIERLQSDLTEEANRKYDFIIERTNAIVGQITDASALTVGAKGDLNGYIKGTKGTAKVQTIGAGGYNIQCFHFRTLINRA